jgi:hypothetical protein
LVTESAVGADSDECREPQLAEDLKATHTFAAAVSQGLRSKSTGLAVWIVASAAALVGRVDVGDQRLATFGVAPTLGDRIVERTVALPISFFRALLANTGHAFDVVDRVTHQAITSTTWSGVTPNFPSRRPRRTTCPRRAG